MLTTNSGCTLMEVLIAMTILSLCLVATIKLESHAMALLARNHRYLLDQLYKPDQLETCTSTPIDDQQSLLNCDSGEWYLAGLP